MSPAQQQPQQPSTSNPENSTTKGDKLYHTVTACVRCRQRKTRCDPGLPRCQPCDRNNARCEYFDAAKDRVMSRDYIVSLQRSVAQLHRELNSLEKEQSQHHVPDAEYLIRGGASIKFSEHGESRYLGPSSGIAITRLVMELAKQNTSSKSIREVVPNVTAKDIKKKFDDESEKPTSKIYPLISSVPAPDLPNHDLMQKLVDQYMIKSQYMLPVLHEPTFRRDVEDVCNGSSDPCKNFQLRMVIANSMQMLDTQFAGLADSYYLAALPYLEDTIKRMDLAVLQCFALIAQYSTLTPTRTAAYWIVGLAARLAQELGLCDEETIEQSSSGVRYNALQIDMRRRLYWITLSMEYGLSHSLGRPSCFGVSVDHINVNFYEMCDDRFITPDGTMPGAHAIMKKCISMHFFRMRLLQAEIRRMLYLKKRDYPCSDQDEWFDEMQMKLDRWLASCPKNDEGSGFSERWFQTRHNTMIIMLFRPSPQIPEPSVEAARKCHAAAVENINFQYQQIIRKLVPVTWIFTLALCMVLNTTLWTLSYAEIRRQYPYQDVKSHVETALDGLELCSHRWPGVQSALQLYRSLIRGCFEAYKTEASFVVSSPSNHASPSSNQEVHSPPAQSPGSHGSPTVSSPPRVYSNYTTPPSRSIASMTGPVPTAAAARVNMSPNQRMSSQPMSPPSPPYQQQQAHYTHMAVQRSMPATTSGLDAWNMEVSSYTAPPAEMAWQNMSDTAEDKSWLGTIGDEYSRYMHSTVFAAPEQKSSLNLQQQSELLASLENYEMPDVSSMSNESRTFYSSQLGL